MYHRNSFLIFQRIQSILKKKFENEHVSCCCYEIRHQTALKYLVVRSMIKVVILVESTSVSIKITFPPVYPLAPGSCAVTVELYEKEVH